MWLVQVWHIVKAFEIGHRVFCNNCNYAHVDNKEDIDKTDLSAARAFQFQKRFLESVIRLNYYEAKVLYDTCIDRMSDFAEDCLADGEDEYYMSVLNFSAGMGALLRTLKSYHEL